MTSEKREAWVGRSFIAVWAIGFVCFFALPMIQALIYSFSKVSFDENGVVTQFIKFENYVYLFARDPNYIRQLAESFINLGYELPIIAIFSLFIALILNQRFRGRVFARILFFMPVIVASGVIIELLKENGMSTSLGATVNAYIYQDQGIQELMERFGFSQGIIGFVSGLINRIFDVSWKSGIQILLYLAGLQTIPKSYYEVAMIEGGTGWETFWKVTFPVISPITLVCIIYTLIDSFTYKENPVMVNISQAFSELRVGQSSAGAWFYFIVVFIVMGITLGIISKFVYYNED